MLQSHVESSLKSSETKCESAHGRSVDRAVDNSPKGSNGQRTEMGQVDINATVVRKDTQPDCDQPKLRGPQDPAGNGEPRNCVQLVRKRICLPQYSRSDPQVHTLLHTIMC